MGGRYKKIKPPGRGQETIIFLRNGLSLVLTKKVFGLLINTNFGRKKYFPSRLSSNFFVKSKNIEWIPIFFFFFFEKQATLVIKPFAMCMVFSKNMLFWCNIKKKGTF